MSYLPVSKNIASYLAGKTGLSKEKETILAYATEILMLNILNVTLIIILGWLLGVFPGTISCLIMFAFFRHTAGGVHSNSPWRCAIITVLSIPSIALLAAFVSRLGGFYSDVLSIIAVLTGFIAITVLAPVDSPAAPIISPERRKRLKMLALLIMALVAVMIIYLRASTWYYATDIQLSLVFGVMWVCLMLSKFGHNLIAIVDGVKKGEKGGEKQ